MTISEANMKEAELLCDFAQRSPHGSSSATNMIAASLQSRDDAAQNTRATPTVDHIYSDNKQTLINCLEKIARYEKALQFYADREYEEYGIGEDRGTTARKALEAKE